MSLTVIGPAIIALGLIVLTCKPHSLVYYVLFFAPFSATAVVNFTSLGYKNGGVGLTPAILFLFLFFVAQILYGNVFQPLRVSRGHVIQLALIGAFSLECIALLLCTAAMRGITSYQVTQTIYLFISIFCTFALSLELARGNALEMAVTVLRASATFVSLWGLLQLFCFVADLPYPSSIFNNSLSDFADSFDENLGDITRIASVAVEPSFFAAAMLHFGAFGATVLIYEKRFRSWEWIVPVAVTLATLMLSTSTTAYLGVAVLVLLLLMQQPRRTMFAVAPMVAAALLAIVMVPKIQNVLLITTFEKGSTFSYQDRLEHMQLALDMFLKAPLFGWGWASIPSLNILTMLLANVGIIGTILALAAGASTLIDLWIGRSNVRSNGDWKLVAYAAGAQNALIVSFACAVTSGFKYVVLDDACYWAIAIAITTRLAIGQSSNTVYRQRTGWDDAHATLSLHE